jgi:predicted dinucleotide-binding enzyme
VNVTIIGTGNMARGIATRALAGGHRVTFIGTHVSKAEDLADELSGLGEVVGAEAADAAPAEIVVVATQYSDAPHAVRQHSDALAGAVLVDVTNPVDLSVLAPLDVSPFDSGAEVIADVAPDGTPVVKAFNTTFAGTLLAGEVAGHPLDVFMASDDDQAKHTVGQLVRDGGMRPVDAGALRRARELEAAGLLHMVVQGSTGTAFASALKIVP